MDGMDTDTKFQILEKRTKGREEEVREEKWKEKEMDRRQGRSGECREYHDGERTGNEEEGRNRDQREQRKGREGRKEERGRNMGTIVRNETIGKGREEIER